jgi:hypothetical protein
MIIIIMISEKFSKNADEELLEWRAPKFLVRTKKGPTMLKNGSSWNLVPLPASNSKGGERGVLNAPRLD